MYTNITECVKQPYICWFQSVVESVNIKQKLL